MTVTYRRIPSTDPRLARHVRHDDASWNYRFPTEGLSIVSAKHTRRIPVLDQGQLGSCTGNAGIGCLGTDPFWVTVAGAAAGPTGIPWYKLNEAGAVDLYSHATLSDDYPGNYPPDDTGSDGLTIAKVLKSAGEISGYQHTFSRDDALKALGVTPAIVGIPWTNDMFNPDGDGRVHPTGSIAGGHEICADEVDAENQRVWFTNSWGTSFGVNGRFYLSFADFGDLLSQQGDVTIFTPLTQPAPTPTPADADHQLLTDLEHWLAEHHVGDNARAKAAVLRWKTVKGL
jgi:hypothetical protein